MKIGLELLSLHLFPTKAIQSLIKHSLKDMQKIAMPVDFSQQIPKGTTFGLSRSSASIRTVMLSSRCLKDYI